MRPAPSTLGLAARKRPRREAEPCREWPLDGYFFGLASDFFGFASDFIGLAFDFTRL
jgi:hypothetical protein